MRRWLWGGPGLAASGEGTCCKRLLQVSLIRTAGYRRLSLRVKPSQSGSRRNRWSRCQELTLNNFQDFPNCFNGLPNAMFMPRGFTTKLGIQRTRRALERDIFHGAVVSGPTESRPTARKGRDIFPLILPEPA